MKLYKKLTPAMRPQTKRLLFNLQVEFRESEMA
jgi:hypothetical protein